MHAKRLTAIACWGLVWLSLHGMIFAAEPAAAGLDAGALARIAPRMQQFVDQHQAAGVVTLVARHGHVAHVAAVGLADIEKRQPMRTDSLFLIASMTKPITATALMILVDEGKLSLDDPVAKYIPPFRDVTVNGQPLERAITVRHLLTHTSGIASDQRNRGSLAETVESLAKQPLKFQPGAQWMYGPGLTVCGRLIEIVAQQPFSGFLQTRIFQPLKMADTTFFPTAAQQQRLARLYKPSKSKKGLEQAGHWLLDVSGRSSPNPSGGLYSTAGDLARFYRMIVRGGESDGVRIVSQKAVQEMTRIHTDDLKTGFTTGNGWGLGWCVVREPQGVTRMLSPGTCGHGGAFGTQGWIDPRRDMIFVMLVQRMDFGNGDASELRDAFQQLAVEAVRN